MRIRLASVPVSDQDHALRFYTEKLGFLVKRDIPMGHGARLITLVAPDDPDGAQLMLEPCGEHPPTKVYKQALVDEGIPFNAFEVQDCKAEFERLKSLGVEFKVAPMDAGMSIVATFDDTCGNLIMIYEEKATD